MHGWGGSMDSFIGVANFFCKNFRCTLLDFAGFGKSPITKPLSLLNYCEQVEEIIEKENLQDITVVAHSFGGRVALLLANRSIKIKSLVLIDSAGLKPKKSLKVYKRQCNYSIKKALKMDTTHCGSSDYKALSPIMKQTFINIVNTNLDYLLPLIRQQTLIFWGSKDKETPIYMAKKMHKFIKNSGLVIVDGGHFSYIDKFYDFLSILSSFLEGIYNVDNNKFS